MRLFFIKVHQLHILTTNKVGDNGIVSNYQLINENYKQNPLAYIAEHGADDKFTRNMVNILTTTSNEL